MGILFGLFYKICAVFLCLAALRPESGEPAGRRRRSAGTTADLFARESGGLLCPRGLGKNLKATEIQRISVAFHLPPRCVSSKAPGLLAAGFSSPALEGHGSSLGFRQAAEASVIPLRERAFGDPDLAAKATETITSKNPIAFWRVMVSFKIQTSRMNS